METEVRRSAVIEVEESAALGLHICGIQRKLLMAALVQKMTILCLPTCLCLCTGYIRSIITVFF